MAVYAIRLLSLCYGLFLTTLLLVPNPAGLLGVRPGLVPNRGVHFCFFAVLALLLHLSGFRLRERILLGALLVYALATESLQWFVPHRTVELLDYTENILGLIAGTLAWQAGCAFWRSTVRWSPSRPVDSPEGS